MTIKRILVAVDYSECSRKACALAAELAETFGASLDIVHAWDRPLYVSDTVVVRHPDGAPRSLIEMIRENAEKEMVTFLAEAMLPKAVPVTSRLVSGEPASRLLEELKQQKHDLVVMGTHGRSGLAHLLLGSVAEKLVRLSPVPVLTVPPDRRGA